MRGGIVAKDSKISDEMKVLSRSSVILGPLKQTKYMCCSLDLKAMQP